MKFYPLSVFFELLFLISLFPLFALGADFPCVNATSDCSGSLVMGDKSNFSYFATWPLRETNVETVRAIVVMHGIARNADEYFLNMVKAANTERALRETVIVAPHFKTIDDKPGNNELYWDEGDWKQGDNSLSSEQVSSFTVMDAIVTELMNPFIFPALKEIVITGHSVGAQFVDRYLAGNRLPENSRIQVKYVVANPSSYLYLNDQRARPGSLDTFEKPLSGCDNYNQYSYGLNSKNAYMSQLSDEQIIRNATERHVIVLIGEADTGTEDLDMTCAANLEGKNRLERSRTYVNYLKYFFPTANIQFTPVPGVAHDNDLMYNSDVGRQVLFH